MKNTPQRMCVACREMKDKSQLVRVVKYGDEIKVDLTDKAPGRGAYVCKSKECVDKLKKRKMLNRAFRCEVPEAVYAQLEVQYE
ncbi:MAG: YlxR family protein [Clostridia bacterium]|nr:YlxR family protein [Clostridia bacterium]